MAEIKEENKSYAYQKFKALCDERNVTPYKVSARSKGGISTSVLSQWKYGEYELKLDKLKVIAEFFGVPVTEFIE